MATEADFIDQIALEMHSRADRDGYLLPWSKQSSKYRAQVRCNVRDVLEAVEGLGLVLKKKGEA